MTLMLRLVTVWLVVFVIGLVFQLVIPMWATFLMALVAGWVVTLLSIKR